MEITISVYLFTQYISSFFSIANIFSGFFDDIFFKNFHCAVITTTGIPRFPQFRFPQFSIYRGL